MRMRLSISNEKLLRLEGALRFESEERESEGEEGATPGKKNIQWIASAKVAIVAIVRCHPYFGVLTSCWLSLLLGSEVAEVGSSMLLGARKCAIVISWGVWCRTSLQQSPLGLRG